MPFGDHRNAVSLGLVQSSLFRDLWLVPGIRPRAVSIQPRHSGWVLLSRFPLEERMSGRSTDWNFAKLTFQLCNFSVEDIFVDLLQFVRAVFYQFSRLYLGFHLLRFCILLLLSCLVGLLGLFGIDCRFLLWNFILVILIVLADMSTVSRVPNVITGFAALTLFASAPTRRVEPASTSAWSCSPSGYGCCLPTSA